MRAVAYTMVTTGFLARPELLLGSRLNSRGEDRENGKTRVISLRGTARATTLRKAEKGG